MNSSKNYIVLARRYRPTRLRDLIGQEILQKTLTEAIEKNHLPHAILLHGIRGVGKTTVARIIARTLNCLGVDGKREHNVVEPCGVCSSCEDVQNGRHLDVVEIDAASYTSVDNIRAIIDSSRYKAVKGRYKIFIIDEVHMLSKSAFNSLLKTLEEPPPHVKFIFATTELRKIPDTILSRCMRFDLKRIDPVLALSHMQNICTTETITADVDALGMIARAGDGSMRDSLSLLDQAIALSFQSGNHITVDLVQSMLGATNKSHIFTLIHLLFQGKTEAVVSLGQELFQGGADPFLIIQETLECIYWLTCIKSNPKMLEDPTWSLHERQKAQEILENLGIPSLARAWQVLSKGYEEMQKNPLPKQACIMVLVRLCHLGNLPQLEKIITMISSSGGGTTSERGGNLNGTGESSSSSSLVAAQASPPFSSLPQTFEQMVKLLREHNEILLASQLEQDVYVSHFKPGAIHMSFDSKRLGHIPAKLRALLKKLTQTDWTLTVSSAITGMTLQQMHEERTEALLTKAKELPLMKELLSIFPNATLTMEESHASN